MPDDLSSIEGLADKHRRVLARHHVTDLRGLVQSDRQMIHRAMANLRPRPTLELISRWQDDARGQLDVAVTDVSDWHTAASFVVIFSQRQREGTWERRVEMERTEVEPERHPQVRSGWDCAPVCTWMTSQLTQPDRAAVRSSGEPAPASPEPVEAVPPGLAVSPRPGSTSGPGPVTKRPQLRIDSAAIIDADGRTDVVTAGRSATDPRTSLVAPVRVVLTVGGIGPDAQLRAVTRVQGLNGSGWNPQDPVALPASGRAEFDLSAVPAGDHEISLIAWAPDASARPVSIRVPKVTIHPAAP